MPRELGKLPDNVKPGICMLEYADTSAGKTHSAITGIPKILLLNKEPKDPRLVHSISCPNYSDLIDYIEFDGFHDEIGYLDALIQRYRSGERPYETIFHDGLTFTMAFYKQALEDDRYRARELAKKDEEKPRPGLVDRARLERPDWGTLASLTARETRLLHELSKFGLLVVSTAIAAEYPKWNSTIRVAPSLVGQEFPKLIHGWFDTIGYIVEPFHMLPGGQIVTPKISFASTDDGMSNAYMCRGNPILLRAEAKWGPLPLNLTKIAQIIRGEFGNLT
jgi:hypothetical protein